MIAMPMVQSHWQLHWSLNAKIVRLAYVPKAHQPNPQLKFSNAAVQQSPAPPIDGLV